MNISNLILNYKVFKWTQIQFDVLNFLEIEEILKFCKTKENNIANIFSD